jgi:dTMP kinase
VAQKNIGRGLLITFEGFEGSGKSTQIRLLADFLRKRNYPVLVLREPGSTRIGEKIRKILLDKNNAFICHSAELLLYAASRAQLVQERILPALEKGMMVLCDRFHDSTVAYQGFGLGMKMKAISLLGELVTLDVKPDLTILLDIAVNKGLQRISGNEDRIEQRSLRYHRRVRSGYLQIAKNEPRRVRVIKVKDIKSTHGRIRKIIEDFILNC